MYKNDKAKFEKKKNKHKLTKITQLAPAFQKYSPNQALSVEIKYTPIFEDFMGRNQFKMNLMFTVIKNKQI